MSIKIFYLFFLSLCSIVVFASSDDLNKLLDGNNKKDWYYNPNLTKPLLGSKCTNEAKLTFEKEGQKVNINPCIADRLKLPKNVKVFRWEISAITDDNKSYLLTLESDKNKPTKLKVVFSNDSAETNIESFKVTTIPESGAPRYNLYFHSKTKQ